MPRRPSIKLLRRANRLPRSTWWALIKVLPAVLVARIALWVLPFHLVARLFEPAVGRPIQDYRTVLRTTRVATWVGRTFLGDMPCLAQALAARWLLGRAGYQADLKLGAKMENGKLAAHAWLERGDRVILGGADSPTEYSAFKALTAEQTPEPELSGAL